MSQTAKVNVDAHLARLRVETGHLLGLLDDPHPGLATWMTAFCAAAETLLPDLAVVAGIEAEVRAAMREKVAGESPGS